MCTSTCSRAPSEGSWCRQGPVSISPVSISPVSISRGARPGREGLCPPSAALGTDPLPIAPLCCGGLFGLPAVMAPRDTRACSARWFPSGVMLAALQLSGCTGVVFFPSFLCCFLWSYQKIGSCCLTAASSSPALQPERNTGTPPAQRWEGRGAGRDGFTRVL